MNRGVEQILQIEPLRFQYYYRVVKETGDGGFKRRTRLGCQEITHHNQS